MSTTVLKENPQSEVELKCDRCGKARPLKLYRPNAGKHPTKRVALCAECANADPNAIPVEGAKPPWPPAEAGITGGKPQVGEPVPTPAADEVETIKFDPVALAPLKTSEPQTEAPQQHVKPDNKIRSGDNKAEDVETNPIDRASIENKINVYTHDVELLNDQGKKLTAKLNQIAEIIKAKRGAIAGLGSLLG